MIIIPIIVIISSIFLFLRDYPNDRFLAVIFILSGIIQIFENFGCFRINQLFINPIFYLLIFIKIFSLSTYFIRKWWFNPVILYMSICLLYSLYMILIRKS
jgi:hypothetical protein